MNLLLDTHTFLWFAGKEQATLLPQATKDLLEDGNNAIFLSLASVWELTIKVSIGKLKLSEPVMNLVEFHRNHNDITLLPISLDHLDRIERMPFHHKDPFDRLLVAQSDVENYPLVSLDVVLDQYAISRIWLE